MFYRPKGLIITLRISLPIGEGWGGAPSTGVDTPAYVLAPYGLIMSLRISTPT